MCVNDFSETTVPRILKFGTNYGYDLLHCVRENQPPDAYYFLHLSIFLSLQSNSLLQISRLLWESESSNFLYTLRVAKYIVGQKTKMLRFIFTIFFHFSISHSNHREICVKDFSGTTAPRSLKFGTNVGYDWLYCVQENQHAAAFHFLCPFFFLSNKTFRHRILSSYYSQSLQILYTPWEGPSILWERKPRFCDYFMPSFFIFPSLILM